MRTSCIALASLCLVFAACASTAKYEEKIARWVGHSEEELVKSWGPPSAVYESAGKKFISYAHSAQANAPVGARGYQTYAVGDMPFPQPVDTLSNRIEPQTCNTTFESQNGKITAWNLEGNACRSR